MSRGKKVLRLKYWGNNDLSQPTISLLDNPNELRLATGPKAFISVKEDQISIAAGTPAVINIQGLSTSMKYAGMIQDLPFPLTLLPTTPFTPFPKQIIVPPLADLLPTLRQVASVASSLIGL